MVRGNGKALWSDVPSTKHSFSEDKLTSHVEYLIDNIYVNVGNKVFRQCVGIPMGTDCAPLLANLFLFYYEYKYMKQLIKTNIIKASRDGQMGPPGPLAAPCSLLAAPALYFF